MQASVRLPTFSSELTSEANSFYVSHMASIKWGKELLPHPRQRLLGELIVYLCFGVIVHNAQTSLIPHDQSKPNILWSLYG